MAKTTEIWDEYVTTNEAARIAGCEPANIRIRIANGRLSSRKLDEGHPRKKNGKKTDRPGVVVVPLEEVKDLLVEQVTGRPRHATPQLIRPGYVLKLRRV